MRSRFGVLVRYAGGSAARSDGNATMISPNLRMCKKRRDASLEDRPTCHRQQLLGDRASQSEPASSSRDDRRHEHRSELYGHPGARGAQSAYVLGAGCGFEALGSRCDVPN